MSMKHLLIFCVLLVASYVGAQAVTPGTLCTAKWHPYGGAISSGSKTFTSSYADFTKAGVKLHLLVSGAGASGVDLITTCSTQRDGTCITSDAASTPVTNAAFVFGASVDDTVALRKVIAAGGRIVLPAGVCPISSTLTINLPDDSSVGMVIEGGGNFASTTLLWIGAAGTSGATGPNIIAVGDGLAVGPGPVKVDGVQFTSLDAAHKAGGGLRWLNGGLDEVTNSLFGLLSDGVSASNNMKSRIDFNHFARTTRDAIAFDAGQGGPVNSTSVIFNEFYYCGRYCFENTSGGSGGSNVNWVAFNDFEGQIADKTLGMFYSIGAREVYAFNRHEDGVHSAPTYRTATFGAQARVLGNAFNQIPTADYTIEFLVGGESHLSANTYNGSSSLGVAEFDAGGAFGSTSSSEELAYGAVGGTFGPYVQFAVSGRGLVAGNLTKAVANGALPPTLGDAGISAANVVTTCAGSNAVGHATCWKTGTTVGYVAPDGTCVCN